MCTRNRVQTTRAEQPGGISPAVHSVLAVFVSKEPRPPEHCPADGVSTYLALIFGTLLSSQGTDASFVVTLSGFPPGASLRSCCFAFPTLSDRFTGRFPRRLAGPALRFPAFRLSGESDSIRS